MPTPENISRSSAVPLYSPGNALSPSNTLGGHSAPVTRKPVPSRSVSTINVDAFSRSTGSDGTAVGKGTSPAIESQNLINLADTHDNSQHLDSQEPIIWGVRWHKQPTFIVLFLLAGLGLALGHHFYYAIAILVVAVLHRANGEAYQQYLWMIVRRRSFTLGSLDKLFALTSDPLGCFGLEVQRHATVAVWLALACW